MIEEIRLKICNILEGYGLDPKHVLQDGMSEAGYESLSIHGGGVPIFESGALPRVRKEWPDGCWEEIKEVYR